MENRCFACMRVVAPGTTRCPHCGSAVPCKQSSPYALQPGTVLMNRFIIGHEQGHGGFGITYIAYDTQLQTVRAIKEFFPQRGCIRNPDLSPRIQPGYEETFERNKQHFLHEARMMMEADSHKVENVVKIVDMFNLNGTAYILMEFLTGCTVDQYIAKNGPMEPEKALDVFRTALKALDGLHKAGIMHRDMSMSNIFMLDSGEIRLIDLGSSEHLSDGMKHPERLWPSRKEDYSPIEQIKKQPQGTYTDVYAAAVTLFKMLSRRSPGVQPGDPLPPISQVVEKKELSHLDSILIQATQRDPVKRTQTAEMLLKQLTPKKSGKKKFVFLGLGVAAAAAAVVMIMSGNGQTGESSGTAGSTETPGRMSALTQTLIGETPETGTETGNVSKPASQVSASVSQPDPTPVVTPEPTPIPYEDIVIDDNPFILVEEYGETRRYVGEKNSVDFSGTAFGGVKIQILLNGGKNNGGTEYTIPVPDAGDWSISIPSTTFETLVQNTVEVRYVDTDQHAAKTDFFYKVMQAPEIDVGEAGITTKTTEISGSADNGATVTLYVNNEQRGMPVTATIVGFSFEGVTLNAQDKVEVEAENALGSVKRSEPVTVQAVQRKVLNIAFQGNENASMLEIGKSGCNIVVTGEKNQEAVVTVSGEEKYRDLLNDDGEWIIVLNPQRLGMANQQPYTLVASYSDGEGNVSSPLTVTPILEAGSIYVNSVNEESTEITGTVKPNSTVYMVRNGETKDQYSKDGTFKFAVSQLKANESLVFYGEDQFQNRTDEQKITVQEIVLDQIFITTPVILYGQKDLPLTIEGTASAKRDLRITVDGRDQGGFKSTESGTWSFKLKQENISNNQASIAVFYANRSDGKTAAATYQFDLECEDTKVDAITEGDTQLTGTAENGATLKAIDGSGKEIGSGVSQGGRYTIKLTRPVSGGETVKITTVDAVGNAGKDGSVTAEKKKERLAGGIDKKSEFPEDGFVELRGIWVLGSTEVESAACKIMDVETGEIVSTQNLKDGDEEDRIEKVQENPNVADDVFLYKKAILMMVSEGTIAYGKEYRATLYVNGNEEIDSVTFRIDQVAEEDDTPKMQGSIMEQSDFMYALDLDMPPVVENNKNVTLTGYFYAPKGYQVTIYFYEGDEKLTVGDPKTYSRDSENLVISKLFETPDTSKAGLTYTIKKLPSGSHKITPKVRVIDNYSNVYNHELEPFTVVIP